MVGLDNINDYYNVYMKYARLAEIGIYAPEETDRIGYKPQTTIDNGVTKFAELFKSIKW